MLTEEERKLFREAVRVVLASIRDRTEPGSDEENEALYELQDMSDSLTTVGSDAQTNLCNRQETEDNG